MKQMNKKPTLNYNVVYFAVKELSTFNKNNYKLRMMNLHQYVNLFKIVLYISMVIKK